MKIKSVRQESIVKQFYIYFVVASVIPLIILFSLLLRFVTLDTGDASRPNFKFLIIIAGVFTILGFWGSRSFLVKIAALSKRLKEATPDKFDKEKILELANGDTEVANLAKIFGDIATKLESNVKELEHTKKTLYRVLSRVGKAIASVENFDLLIQFILETTVEALGANRGAIFYLDEEKNVLKLKALLGCETKEVPEEIKIGEEAVGWVAKEKRPLFVPSLDDKEHSAIFSSPLIAAPLISHDKVLGVISLSGRHQGSNFTEDELKILSNLAYQIATSFENAKLNTEFEKTYFDTISALALAVEAKDRYSRGHSDKVSEYALKIAKGLGLCDDDLETLRDAARLHDIGKIGVSDGILQKNSRLDDEENVIMRKHPLIGEGIVRPLKTFQHILDPVKHHHELLDGSGYPDGLTAKDIPLITRILTVADIFDALTTDRPYRKALGIDEAKRQLQMMVDLGKIDKTVVAELFRLIDSKAL